MSVAKVLSRRGIVGMLALAASSPKAVAAQAEEAIRDVMAPDYGQPSIGGPMTATGGPGGGMNLAQRLAGRVAKQARKRAYAKAEAINACHSMSKAAKRAYVEDAHSAARGLDYQFAKLMGWTDGEQEDWG